MVFMVYPYNQLITLLMKLKKCWTVEGKDEEREREILMEQGINHFSYTNEIEGENRFT